jgi:tRNA1(Val) A37 N6-methylase TrmN6
METVTVLKRKGKTYLIVSVNGFLTVTDCVSLNKLQKELLRQAYRKTKNEEERALINVCLQSKLNL